MGVVAALVYIRTLAPGMVAEMDVPLFQFVGRALGVAHNPGYPLFVLLTYPFSYLPVGSVAYRINLFSGLLGAITVSLVFLIARRLGCRTIVAASAALGLAFGRVFWSQSVIAEVYTLNSAIVAGILLALLEWRDSRRAGWYWTAIGLFAIGLGNHTTIVGFVPAMAVLALLTDRAFVLRPRAVLGACAVVLAGLLQYGFILLRTRDATAHVESPARTLPELVGVLRGRQFHDFIFIFDWRTVIVERPPLLFEWVLRPELTLAGLALAVIGVAWLLRRRMAEGLYLVIGFTVIFVFCLNYGAADIPVFVIPALLMLWIAAAVGAEQVVRRVEARSPHMAILLAPVLLLLPAVNVSRNFATNDRSRDTDAHVTFERLFASLPERAVLVREDFLVDRMVTAFLHNPDATQDKRIETGPSEAGPLLERHADGFTVFAFEKAARGLRLEGLDFDYAPLLLSETPLPSFLARLPDGVVVALAVPSQHSTGLADVAADLRAIGWDEGLALDDRPTPRSSVRGGRAMVPSNASVRST